MVPVDSLIPYARNARTHSEEQIAQIAASIREFGWTNPILTDGDKGVIAGHGRLAAARKLELTEVPVIELGHLSPEQKKAYILADNRIALNSGWDEELLKLELQELQGVDFDLDLLGFGDDEIERLQAFRGNDQLHAALGCIGVSGSQSCVAQRGEHLDECAAFEVVREVGQQFLRMLGRCFEQAALGVREFHFLPFDVVDVFCAAATPAA